MRVHNSFIVRREPHILLRLHPPFSYFFLKNFGLGIRSEPPRECSWSGGRPAGGFPPARASDGGPYRGGFFLINRPRTPLQRDQKKASPIEDEEESAATTSNCLLRTAAFERPAFR